MTKPILKRVRVNPALLDEYRKKHTDLADLPDKELVSIMLRKALEADKP